MSTFPLPLTKNLHRHTHLFNLCLRQGARMRRANDIHQSLPLRPQLEHSPAAVAVTDRADLLKLGLQLLCHGLHFRVALVFAIAAHECTHVEIGALGWVGEHAGRDDFAAEEVGQVDCAAGLGGELVGFGGSVEEDKVRGDVVDVRDLPIVLSWETSSQTHRG